MKKILKWASIGTITTMPFVTVVACSQKIEDQAWVTEVKMAMNKGWYDDKVGSEKKLDQFLVDFAAKFNELKNKKAETKNFKDVKFNFIAAKLDHNLNIQDLQSSITDFAITNSSSVAKANPQNLPAKEIQSLLQTTTTAFSFDADETSTDNEQEYTKIVAKMQELFDKKPFMEWNKDSEKWTGARWDFLYDTTKIVNFYRGVITIVGTEEKRNQIKKAWNDKDWNTFRNFGIITKSSFELHEKRLKEHFNLSSNTFTTLAEDKLQNTEKYSSEKRWKLGQIDNFAIALDDEASFAWEKNKNVGAKEKEIKFTAKNGEKLEFLTLTEKRKFDIGSFRKGFNTLQAELIVETFIELAKENKDTYGPWVGYNGYAKFKK